MVITKPSPAKTGGAAISRQGRVSSTTSFILIPPLGPCWSQDFCTYYLQLKPLPSAGVQRCFGSLQDHLELPRQGKKPAETAAARYSTSPILSAEFFRTGGICCSLPLRRERRRGLRHEENARWEECVRFGVNSALIRRGGLHSAY